MTKKATRKFAASGKLKQAIQARHKHKQIKKKIEARKGKKSKGPKTNAALINGRDEEEEGEADIEMEERKSLESDEEGNEEVDREEESNDDEDDEDAEDLESLDLSEEEDEGTNHMMDLEKLKEKDPEFYKYLQQNDKELLEFNAAEAMEGIDLSDEEIGDEETTPILTLQILRSWQKALLEQRSLRALRKLLLAFRSAAYTNDEDVEVAWNINDASSFDKVINTTLKYTPMVLEHHIPYRSLPNGKYKPPIQSPKQQKLSKLIASFFSTTSHLLTQLTSPELIVACLTGSAKLVPYISGNRKAMKSYLKTCLGLWASPSVTGDGSDDEDREDNQVDGDKVRVAAFLSMKRIAMSSDEGALDLVLKGSYTTLLRASRSTNIYSLPSINLMKNTAVDLYCIDQGASYQLAFGYIRQLAVNVRNALKGGVKGKESKKDKEGEFSKPKKTDEPFKQVYNWKFVHAVDFWSMLLSRTCDTKIDGGENELQPLIYPLVQVALGSIRLVSTPRYYPFHIHMLQSTLSLSRHTGTYIPLAPHLLSILSSLSSTKAVHTPQSNAKARDSANTTLKPLQLSTHVRAPGAYLKARVFIDGVTDEALFLFLQWAALLQSSIAFPEIMVPVLVGLKRSLKSAKTTKGNEKVVQNIKTTIERVEEGRTWVMEKRKGVTFGPDNRSEVDHWQERMQRLVEKNETPVGKYANVLEKKRNREQAVLERARKGKGEILADD